MANRSLKDREYKTATCNIYDKYEKPVQGGLALTPQKVKELTDKGLAVSTPNQGFNDDPQFSDSWFIEPQFRRGCDMNTAWEISQFTQSKLVNAHKSDKRKFGG